jgi:hypothetical protein
VKAVAAVPRSTSSFLERNVGMTTRWATAAAGRRARVALLAAEARVSANVRPTRRIGVEIRYWRDSQCLTSEITTVVPVE